MVERYVDIVEVASSILAIPTTTSNEKAFLFVWLKINLTLLFLVWYTLFAGDYCEGAIPDPIPNSEVNPFSADGTLS